MVSVTDVIQGVQRPTPAPRQRVAALVLGARGEFGERLLDRVLAHVDYAQVYVATTAPLQSSDAKLRAWVVDARLWDDAPDLPPIRDAYLMVDLKAGRRDLAFRELLTSELLAVGKLLAKRGVARVGVVAPMAAFLQMHSNAAASLDGLESELAQVNLPMVAILRPVAHRTPASGNFGERLAQGLVSTLATYMTPQSLAPLTGRELAGAFVDIVTQCERGLHIWDAQRLRERIARAKGGMDRARAKGQQ
jgi:hypothetical protein